MSDWALIEGRGSGILPRQQGPTAKAISVAVSECVAALRFQRKKGRLSDLQAPARKKDQPWLKRELTGVRLRCRREPYGLRLRARVGGNDVLEGIMSARILGQYFLGRVLPGFVVADHRRDRCFAAILRSRNDLEELPVKLLEFAHARPPAVHRFF